jgi:agmatinase
VDLKKLHFLAEPAGGGDSRAPFVVFPIPFERTVSYGRGTAHAPRAILQASVQTELFDEEFFSSQDLKVQTLPSVNCFSTSTALIFKRIRQTAEKVMRQGRFLLSLGGEHTITIPLVAAAKSAYGGLTVLNLDAHLDLRNSFRNNRLSHACVFRRIMETNVPVVQAGIRSLCREEYELIRQRRLKVFWGRSIREAKNEKWIDDLLRQLKRNVYLSIDADVLDLSLMPGTGTPEPGGLSWPLVLRLLRRVCSEKKVVGADIVEVVPQPKTPACEYVAAKLALKLMTYVKKSGTF